MKNYKKILSLGLALLMIVSILSGCSGAKTEGDTTLDATQSGGTAASSTEAATATSDQIPCITFGLEFNQFTLEPFYPSAPARDQFISMLWPRLCVLPYYGASIEEAEMWLAKSITKVDDVTYAVELYDYIVDNQGNEITSQDVKWSYDMNISDAQCSELQAIYGGIDIIDDYNFNIKLNAPGAGKAETLLAYQRLVICDQGWYESTTADEHCVNTATAAAYTVTKYVQGSFAQLEAVDNYWQKDELKGSLEQQNVKTVYLPVIAEPAVRAAALESGEIDVAYISADNLATFYENGQSKDGYNVNITTGNFMTTLFCNMDTESDSIVANNPDLRKAILYALDTDAITVAWGYGGIGQPVYDWGTQQMRWYNPAWADNYFSYNPELARQYVIDAGYEDGVTIRLLKSYVELPIAAVIIDNLEAVGISVDLVMVDQALYDSYKYDSSMWDINADLKGAASIIDFYNNNFLASGYTNGGANFWKDETAYALLEAAGKTGAQEDVDALHNYHVENATGRGLFAGSMIVIAQDGMIELAKDGFLLPQVHASTYASDWSSRGDELYGSK